MQQDLFEDEEKVDDSLKNRARALGVKNVDNLSDEQLNQRIDVMLRVRAEGLTRLEFNEQGELLSTLRNLEILQIQAQQKKSSLSRRDVIEKLQGYRLLTDKLDTHNNRWTRFIDLDDGFLRAGGFPIRNKPFEEFIVLKNVSKKFTFSIKRSNVILMDKLPRDSPSLLTDDAFALATDFGNRNSGSLFVSLSGDFQTVQKSNSVSGLARLIGINRGGLGRNFKNQSQQYKGFYLFKLSIADYQELQVAIERIGNVKIGISDDLMEVIDRFYP